VYAVLARKKPGGPANSAVTDTPAGIEKNLDDVLPIAFRATILRIESCQQNKEDSVKSPRMLSPAGYLALALLGACFGAGIASGQDSKGQLKSWDNLKSLTRGEETLVVTNDVKPHQGKFEFFSDSGITLRLKTGEQTLARKDVFRVSQMVGHNHQVRNAVAGTLVGAATGAAIGLKHYYRPRNCTLGPDFACGYPNNLDLLEWLTPVSGLGGAIVGGFLPTGGWHVVYRAR
jgi:hypothetical protein